MKTELNIFTAWVGSQFPPTHRRIHVHTTFQRFDKGRFSLYVDADVDDMVPLKGPFI